MSQPGSRASAWSVASRSALGAASAVSRSAASAAIVAVGSSEAGQLGRFRVLGELGEGQHATVYRAYDAMLDRDVALAPACIGYSLTLAWNWAKAESSFRQALQLGEHVEAYRQYALLLAALGRFDEAERTRPFEVVAVCRPH